MKSTLKNTVGILLAGVVVIVVVIAMGSWAVSDATKTLHSEQAQASAQAAAKQAAAATSHRTRPHPTRPSAVSPKALAALVPDMMGPAYVRRFCAARAVVGDNELSYEAFANGGFTSRADSHAVYDELVKRCR